MLEPVFNQTNCWKSSPRLEPKIKSNKIDADDINVTGFINTDKVEIKCDFKGISVIHKEGPKFIEYRYILNFKKSKKKAGILVRYIEADIDQNLKVLETKIDFNSRDDSECVVKCVNRNVKKFKKLKSATFVVQRGSSVDLEYLDKQMKNLKSLADSLFIKYNTRDIEHDVLNKEEISEILHDKESEAVILVCCDEFLSNFFTDLINYQSNHPNVPSITQKCFGILPIGSHNDVVKAIWKDKSLQQIFLNILLYEVIQVDINSICINDAKSLKWGFNVQYGYYVHLVNKERRDGKSLDKIIKASKRSEKLILEDFLISYSTTEESGLPTDNAFCCFDCDICQPKQPSITLTPIVEFKNDNNDIIKKNRKGTVNHTKSVVKQGRYHWIAINSIPCRNEFCYFGFTPACHYSNNLSDVMLFNDNHKKLFKSFLKQLNLQGNQLGLSFVESARTEEITFMVQVNKSWSGLVDNTTNLDSLSSNTSKISREIIIIDDEISTESDSHSISNEEDQSNGQTKKDLSKKEKIKKAYKDFVKTTEFKSESKYRKPQMTELEKDKSRKNKKLEKSKQKEKEKEAKWMIDYNIIEEPVTKIVIKNHCGLISLFCPITY